MTASQARRNWFTLLDEVAAGAVVCIDRGGRRIVLRREEEEMETVELPDYGALIDVPVVENADQWGWSWSASEEADLEPTVADEADGA
jgi:hypothetical protein